MRIALDLNEDISRIVNFFKLIFILRNRNYFKLANVLIGVYGVGACVCMSLRYWQICLQTTAKRCASAEFTKWRENVGRRNQHHAGFAQMLLRLKLLVHANNTQHSEPSLCGNLLNSK